MSENFRSTKFWSQIVVLALASVMLWHGKLDGATWAMLSAACVGVYAGANVSEKNGARRAIVPDMHRPADIPRPVRKEVAS